MPTPRPRQVCEHGRHRYTCKHCGGSAICEHKRRKVHCRLCHGNLMCLHGRRKSHCRDCHGSQVCTHGLQRLLCLDCPGIHRCPHGTLKYRCRACSGQCEHGTKVFKCKGCWDDMKERVASAILRTPNTAAVKEMAAEDKRVERVVAMAEAVLSQPDECSIQGTESDSFLEWVGTLCEGVGSAAV